MTFSLEEDDLYEEEGDEAHEAGEEAQLGSRLPTPMGHFEPSWEVDPRRYGLWGCALGWLSYELWSSWRDRGER
jgi:hypothetical protein